MTHGEIWWAQFGIPFGSEAGFKRPVLIVQDNSFNESKIRTIVVVPLTTNLQLAEAPGNVLLKKKDSKLTEDSAIIVAQLYAMDRERFIEKVTKIDSDIMEKVESGIKLVLGIR
jgi:mRNA interferase MazF